jgi:hypothetical protein
VKTKRVVLSTTVVAEPGDGLQSEGVFRAAEVIYKSLGY